MPVTPSHKRLPLVINILFSIACMGAMPRVAGAQQVENGRLPAQTAGAPIVSNRIPGVASDTDERYRIGPGDVLEVEVYKQPQLSRPALRVDGRGMIRMPLLEGEIMAACKTESDLSKELTERYAKYQKFPQVDVYIKEFNSEPVAIVGAVNTPGRFQMQRRVRLLELLTLAGGPNAAAGRSIQVVHGVGASQICKGGEAGVERADGLSFYDLNETLRGAEDANPYLMPGDVATLPKAEQVFVIGNVPKPSALPLTEPLTIARAVAMSGGVLPETDKQKLRLIRQPKGNLTKTELIVNLKDINSGDAEDVLLEANDVVEVPKKGGSVLKGILRTLVPSIASLPTRVIY